MGRRTIRAALVALGGCTLLAAAVFWYGSLRTLPGGLTVSGWHAGGIEANQFEKELSERVAALRKRSVSASAAAPGSAEAAERATTLGALGLVTNEDALSEEVARLFEGSVWERALRRWQSRRRPLTLTAELDAGALAAEARRLWPELYAAQPVNAKRSILAGDRIAYTPEIPAPRVDEAGLRAAALRALAGSGGAAASDDAGNAASDGEGAGVTAAGGEGASRTAAANEGGSGNNADAPASAGLDVGPADGPLALPDALRPDGRLLSGAPLRIEAPVVMLQPEVTVATLKAQGIERLIASYTTSFASSGAGRKHNVSKTASVVHDRLMAPGDIFDYGKIIEETESKFGFREAPVILNGKMVPGVGGGICQVSTTLYNAVLRAGLEIVERRNHSLPVSYAPLGQDATFASGYINFKFRNSTGKYILIRTSSEGGKLTIKLYGTMDPSITYDIESVTLQTIAPAKKYVKNLSLAKGEVQLLQRGKPGYVVETYRVKKVNGKAVGKERISKDTYKAQPALYASNSGGASGGKDSSPRRGDSIVEDGIRAPVFD